MKLILAGDYQQYQHYLARTHQSAEENHYVCEPKDLCGWDKGTSVVLVGEWWKNPLAGNERMQYLVQSGEFKKDDE